MSHTPVLLKETLEGLAVASRKQYIDATFGGGGHTRAILAAGGRVLAIDSDRNAYERARKIGSEKLIFVQGNFREIEKIAKANDFCPVDGIVFDLGVSSYQLDRPEEGFSYRFEDADLDMRFDRVTGKSAADLIAKAGENELENVLARYGEEPKAEVLAKLITAGRKKSPIRKAGDIIRIVDTVVDRRNRNATLSRVFQALRIWVNDELEALKEGLEGAVKILKPKGRIAVISFHSLEDRVVKRFSYRAGLHLVYKHPIRPCKREMEVNRRARSAKLRILEIS